MQGAFVRSTIVDFWHYAGTSGLSLYLLIRDSRGYTFNWNTGEFVSNIATATWTDLQAAMTEYVDTGPNGMAVYYKTSIPAAITEGNYTLIVQDGTTAVDDRLAIQPMRWDGTYWTPNTASDANIQALIDLVQATLTIDADPDRTWVMRRHPDRVGSEKVIAKKASENVLLFADVSRLLGENEVIGAVADIDITATGATVSGIAKIGDIIYFVVSGGSAGSTIDVEISFDTNRTAADEPIICNGYLKVVA